MRDTEIVLYQTDWCPYCSRVRDTLDDLQLSYQIVNVPDEHAQRTQLRDLFGLTGVPSITDGDVKIADDDDAIIEYAEKKYGKSA
ncbi:MAG TPA: glutaredoxin [Candidatus Baltobacteraceae bacterium]|nr:glutaredoxin [Candidatus Baltobacteraceae bacterium]